MDEERQSQPEEQKVEQPVPSGTSAPAAETQEVQAASTQTQPTSEPTPPVEAAPVIEEQKTGGVGKRLVVALVVVLVLAVGAVVAGFISGRRARLEKQEMSQKVIPTQAPEEKDDPLTLRYQSMSDSDEIADIEADLAATIFEGIDAELKDIDQEFAAED